MPPSIEIQRLAFENKYITTVFKKGEDPSEIKTNSHANVMHFNRTSAYMSLPILDENGKLHTVI